MRARFLLVPCLVGAASFAPAWNDLGHMAIAARAQTLLSPKARREADRLLATAGSSSFILSATFADDTKNRSTGPHHFINLRYDPANPERDRRVMAEPNVVTVIRKLSATLANRRTSDKEKGAALRLLIHFVADVHQPMHAVTRVTQAFPEGDRGGNDVRIGRVKSFASPPRNLHALWDMGGGAFGARLPQEDRLKLSLAHQIAGILKSQRTARYSASVTEPMKWAEESFEIAKLKAYSLPHGTTPTGAYLQMCRDISLARAELASRRLANLINRAVG